MGMSFGGVFGGTLEPHVGYDNVFNINGFLLIIMFFITLYVYPYDPPLTDVTATGGKGSG